MYMQDLINNLCMSYYLKVIGSHLNNHNRNFHLFGYINADILRLLLHTNLFLWVQNNMNHHVVYNKIYIVKKLGNSLVQNLLHVCIFMYLT